MAAAGFAAGAAAAAVAGGVAAAAAAGFTTGAAAGAAGGAALLAFGRRVCVKFQKYIETNIEVNNTSGELERLDLFRRERKK